MHSEKMYCEVALIGVTTTKQISGNAIKKAKMDLNELPILHTFILA